MDTYLINRWDNLKKTIRSQYQQISPQDLEGDSHEVLPRIAKKLNMTEEALMKELEYLDSHVV